MTGKGHYGRVFQGYLRANPDIKIAVKTFSKSDLTPTVFQFIKEEITAMNRVDHPNICKLLEAYESPSTVYMVIEYCQGGTLYEKLNEDFNQFSEDKSRKIMKRLLQAINHCHAKGIVHRDLKPENIMLKTDSDELNPIDIKLIDFGLCKVLPYNAKLN